MYVQIMPHNELVHLLLQTELFIFDIQIRVIFSHFSLFLT